MKRALMITLAACGTSAAEPAPTRVHVRLEPAGEHCPNGGLAIEVGGDHDTSGALEPGEVESTSYECTPDAPADGEPAVDFTGSVTLRSAADAQRFAHVRSISGSLLIEGTGPIALPALAQVGTLSCIALADGEVALPALRSATDITFTSRCPRTALPALASVDDLSITTTAEPYEFPALQTASSLAIEGPTEIHAPALVTLATVLRSRSATRLEFPALTTGHGLFLSGGTELVAPRLRDATLAYQDNEQLTALAFPALETGSVQLSNLPALAAIDLPLFETGTVQLFNTPAVTALALPRLVTGGVSVDFAQALTTLSLPAYTSGGLSVSSVALSELALPRFAHATSVSIDGLAALQLVDLGRLEDAGLIIVRRTGASVDLGALRTATFVIMTDLGGSTLALPSLISATELDVERNAALTTLSAPALTTLAQLTVQNNPQLPTCVAEELATRTGATAFISGNGNGSCP